MKLVIKAIAFKATETGSIPVEDRRLFLKYMVSEDLGCLFNSISRQSSSSSGLGQYPFTV